MSAEAELDTPRSWGQRHPWKARYHQVRSYVTISLIPRVSTARFFLRLAWKALRHKILIINTRPATANGGYKYINLMISKRPVSADHTYEDL